ncbi:MAG: hypothetical protein QOJ09_1165 [Actinomycetota bacterium]|nr:hypothetical protein [Actinomycetota bacterium]
MTRARARIGALVLVAYVIAAVATVRLTDHHVRPLFEGIGPAPAYQWVDPPSQFASGNVKPHEVSREIPLNAAGSGLTSVQSGDSQAVVNLPAGAVPAEPGQTALAVTFAPLSPKRFAAPPAGVRADGNVYRVTLNYKPSGQAVAVLAKAGNFVMAVPEPGVAILWSADGRRWTKLTTQPVGGVTTLGTRFEKAGYYLGAAALTGTGKKKSNTGTVIALVAIVVGLALALGLGPVLVRRLRRPKSRSEQRRQQRGR